MNFSIDLPTNLEGRILAIDFGMTFVGIAVSDERQFLSRPVRVIKRVSWKVLEQNLLALIQEFDAKALVLGLPVNFDGSEMKLTVIVSKLAEKLKAILPVPVFLEDERLTSKTANDLLYEQGFSPEEIHARIDSEAASIILSDFLDRLRTARMKANNTNCNF